MSVSVIASRCKERNFIRSDAAYLLFDEPQRGITPGQFAAWYDGDELVGSGVIAE